MTLKRKPNEEIFNDGDKQIKLVSNFGFLSAVNSLGRDVALIYYDLSSGLMPPDDIRNVLVSAACDIENGNELIEDLITRYGLQECSVMARTMLSHGMIGDVKKSALSRGDAIQSLIGQLTPSNLMSLKKVGLLWAAILITSTTLVCLIFSLIKAPII